MQSKQEIGNGHVMKVGLFFIAKKDIRSPDQSHPFRAQLYLGFAADHLTGVEGQPWIAPRLTQINVH